MVAAKKPGRGAAAPKAARGKVPPIKFSGTLQQVKVHASKIKESSSGFGMSSRSSQEMTGGSIELTIVVERPKLPKAPEPPRLKGDYEYRRPEDPGDEPEWEEPIREEDETDAAWKKRQTSDAKLKSAHHDRWVRANDAWQKYQDAVAERDAVHAANMDRYERRAQLIGSQFAGFAQLAGVGAVLQGLPFSFSMQPSSAAVSKFLPGFEPAPLQTLQLTEGTEPDEGDD